MHADFARTLSVLRQEKKISQRKAAESLGVSQALLSHYEKGVREPGLEFVVKVSKFYGVSCDYLLGNSMSRDGMGINPESLVDITEVKDNVLKGSAFALLNKKLIVNSVALLMDLVSLSGNKALIQEVSGFLTVAFYKIFRFVYSIDPANNKDFFPISQEFFSEISDMELKKCEMGLRKLEKEEIQLKMSQEDVAKVNPMLAPSLYSLLHNASEKILKKN